MRNYQQYVEGKRREYGDKFSAAALDRRFVRYYESGERIKVNVGEMEITGTVGVTTGWAPTFLLMRTSRSLGSIWTLGQKDKIIAVKRSRKYVPVAA